MKQSGHCLQPGSAHLNLWVQEKLHEQKLRKNTNLYVINYQDGGKVYLNS